MITITAGLLLFCIILTLHPLIILIHSLWQIACNSNPIDLKRTFGDWAVVTGSTDGIGKEYAKELAKKDINIVLISRCLDKLKATKNEIHLLNTNIQIEIIQADFSKNRNEIEKIADKLKDIPVGILVNNVGKLTEYPMYFGEHSRTDLWDIININIAAATLMTHLVIEKMKKKRRGAIVNVSSGIDTIPMPLMSIYASSKTFIRFFSEAIRAEYSKYGLTIQTLAPYYIDTKMVSFVDGIKKRPLIYPDAATYAKSAVNTLGKLNSTAGYWIHDVLRFIVIILPRWLTIRYIYSVIKEERDNYLKSNKKNND